MEIFAKLGVDGKLLLAQAVNFAVLFWVLRRFAYRPMLEFLEKRTERIEQGLKDAEAATAKLFAMEQKEKEVLAAAHQEARTLIIVAEESAKKRDAERMAETEARATQFLAEAEAKISEEKEKVLSEAKAEIAEMVSLGVEKILKEKVDSVKDATVIEKMSK